MAQFATKRLQVFVSSTYTDLIDERQAAVQAILTAGHIPAGMELFTAGDESQMDVIKQWIDESDIYLLILGGRYRSIEAKSGKSYSHLEYDYAVRKKKPLFSCVIDDDAIAKRIQERGREIFETDNPRKLKEFRELVLKRMVKFWSDEKDIKLTVLETIPDLSRREELIGWVRSDQEANAPALADEIARLSKENSELRDRISNNPNASEVVQFSGLTFEELKSVLEKRNELDCFKVLGREFHWGILQIDRELSRKANEEMGVFLEKLMDISRYGLIALTTDFGPTIVTEGAFLAITHPGQTFYNKLDYEQEFSNTLSTMYI